jgi:hypothetical protein
MGKLLTFALLALTATASLQSAREFQRNQLTRLTADFLGPPEPVSKAASAPPATITFANPAAKKFEVDGTRIPNGVFDLFVWEIESLIAFSYLECRSILVGSNAHFEQSERNAETLLLVSEPYPFHAKPA